MVAVALCALLLAPLIWMFRNVETLRLERIHAEHARALAEERAAFSARAAQAAAVTDRFTRYLGVAPMGYLADWRIELGAEALRSGSRSVQSVALDVGYESEAAFNRAFKRRYKVPPARYRRDWRTQSKRNGVRPRLLGNGA